MSVKTTTHGRRVREFFTPLLLITFATAVTTVSSFVHAATPEADFAARCAASGVLVCEGFDSASTFTTSPSQTEGLYPGEIGVKGFQDTSIKASGGSSLRFDIQGLTGSDPAGNFSKNFGQTFSQNSTFYVQWRQMFDSNMLSINWNALMGTSFKQAIMHDRTGYTCANVELTTVNTYATGVPQIYSECGNRAVRTSLTDSTAYTTAVPYLYQQGSSLTSGYNCEYNNEFHGLGDGKGCFYYPANKWVTFYYKISVGSWGNANSSIQAWVSVDGGPYIQWTNVRNYTLNNDGSSSGGWNRIMLTPYMTNKNPSVNHATAHTWYDELIVSTQPIAAPGNGGGGDTLPPAAPTNLTVQ